jgi:hypothetical protein
MVQQRREALNAINTMSSTYGSRETCFSDFKPRRYAPKQLYIPCSRGLFEVVERLVEVASMIEQARINKTSGLTIVHCLY